MMGDFFNMDLINKAIANQFNEKRVFDWEKAAEIIKKKPYVKYFAGLKEDMTFTSGAIFDKGECVTNDYTYLSSTWATPVIVVGEDDVIECWKMESETEWDHDTKWPESALAILGLSATKLIEDKDT